MEWSDCPQGKLLSVKGPSASRPAPQMQLSEHCHNHVCVFLSWKLSSTVGREPQKISKASAYLREFVTGGEILPNETELLRKPLWRQRKLKGHLGPAVAALSCNFALRILWRHFAITLLIEVILAILLFESLALLLVGCSLTSLITPGMSFGKLQSKHH